KIEQVQWNTWVSFQSAQWAKLGQFSVSGNSQTSFCPFQASRAVIDQPNSFNECSAATPHHPLGNSALIPMSQPREGLK
ncbi:hypothetical protein, partial [Pseudomonas asiatica]|uniref:hypothetical protein n=1 Tax=Pseudomonas asiatica TaxID=2219225 RepID=UPI0019D68FB4